MLPPDTFRKKIGQRGVFGFVGVVFVLDVVFACVLFLLREGACFGVCFC